MYVAIQLQPLLVYTIRENADTKPLLTDVYLDINDAITITNELRQICYDKMIEISIHIYELISKLVGCIPEKHLQWNCSIQADGTFVIQTEFQKTLSIQEYYYVTQMINYHVSVCTKQPIGKKDKNILMNLKNTISASHSVESD